MGAQKYFSMCAETMCRSLGSGNWISGLSRSARYLARLSSTFTLRKFWAQGDPLYQILSYMVVSPSRQDCRALISQVFVEPTQDVVQPDHPSIRPAAA